MSKAKTYLIVLLSVATLSLSLIAWNQDRRITALQEELQQASSRAPSRLKPTPAPMFTPPASEPSVALENDDPNEPAANEDAPEQGRRQRNRPSMATLMANPEFAQALKVQRRSALDVRYADLFKQLNLSPAELEKFKDLLVERQTARMDVIAAARENGINPRENRDELRKLTQEAQDEVDANIKAALGETRFNQYQNYETTQPQRAVVSQLDQRLSYNATPLNSAQTEFLINALVNQSSASGGSDNRGANRPMITDTLIQQAQSVLTPKQIQALKELQAEQQAQRQIREMMRANASAPARN